MHPPPLFHTLCGPNVKKKRDLYILYTSIDIYERQSIYLCFFTRKRNIGPPVRVFA